MRWVDWIWTSQGLATIGLVLDMIGVALLFYSVRLLGPPGAGPLSQQAYVDEESGILTHPSEEAKIRIAQWQCRNSCIAWTGLALILIGFGLQIGALYL